MVFVAKAANVAKGTHHVEGLGLLGRSAFVGPRRNGQTTGEDRAGEQPAQATLVRCVLHDGFLTEFQEKGRGQLPPPLLGQY
jgi:hypothetical protein